MSKKETKDIEVKEEEVVEEATQEEEVKKPVNKKMKWYIVRSSSGKENSVAEQLKQRVRANDLDKYVEDIVIPTQEKIVIKRGKKQTIEERIFPGYILLNMEFNDEMNHLIINTDGVLGFVGYSQAKKRPTPLNKKEVESILAFMKVKQMPTYQAKFNKGDAVKVGDGPFKEFIGTVQEVNDSKGQVTVLLSIFGRETPVQLEFSQVTSI